MSRNDDDPPLLRRRRRSWSLEEKRRILDENLKDVASIVEVARRHDLNTNQLFTWHRQFGVEATAPQELAQILPLIITPDTTRNKVWLSTPALSHEGCQPRPP